MESGVSWKDNEGGGGGVISLTTVDWRKGCWGLFWFVLSVCVFFGRMRVSANQVLEVSRLKFYFSLKIAFLAVLYKAPHNSFQLHFLSSGSSK